MHRYISLFLYLSLALFCFNSSISAFAQDNRHWSTQFPRPASITKMSGHTGMSDGAGKPSLKMARWYKGKLYLSGRWENSLNPDNPNMILTAANGRSLFRAFVGAEA